MKEDVLAVPDLPDFDPAAAVCLRDVCNHGLVKGPKGRRMNLGALRAWVTRGCRLVRGHPRYRFPAVLVGHEYHTTPAWVAAWLALAARVKAADARRQLDLWERCKAAARGAGR